MQGMFQLILRGKKKDIERFRQESGIADLPEHPSGLRDFSSNEEFFPVDYDRAADDDIVKYSFATDTSGNIAGRDEWAKEVNKAFPEFELLLNITYLDYDNCGDVVYSPAGSAECSKHNWIQNGYPIDFDDKLDWEQIEDKIDELRTQGLDCDYDDAASAIFVKEEGRNWEFDNGPKEEIGSIEAMMDTSDLFNGYSLAQRRKERDILEWVSQNVDVAVSGSAFVLTGDFIHCGGDRDEVKTLIESKGGRCTAAVSGKTSYLVLGGQGGFGEKKVEKVQELQEKGKDIKIITEDNLFKFLD